jgi:3-oxoacyl-[acyl-carrier protein] reductase
MSQSLTGKVAVVTGGTRGIGAGITRRLVSEGARVAITYRTSDTEAKTLIDEAAAKGGEIIARQIDAGDRAAIRAGIDDIARTLGGIDILVNNAGGGAFAAIEEVTDEMFDQMVGANLSGTYFTIQAALAHMGSGGRIINIGSVNADRIPFPNASLYVLTKGGVAGLTRGLARELAPKGITINNVQPGPTHTPQNPGDGPMSGLQLPFMALDRFGTVEEIGGLVTYLAGPDAGSVTGANINIDGGFAV